MEKEQTFPITVNIVIQWGDMDAFNHVNNIMFFKYFETARIQYFEEIGLIENMKKTNIGPILAHTSCKFIKPITYPDTIAVGASVKSIGNTSFIMEFTINSKKNKLSATGDAVMVVIDYNKGLKTSIPENILQAIKDLEKRDF